MNTEQNNSLRNESEAALNKPQDVTADGLVVEQTVELTKYDASNYRSAPVPKKYVSNKIQPITASEESSAMGAEGGTKEGKTADGSTKDAKKDEKSEAEKQKEKEKFEKANKKATEMVRDIFRTYRCQILSGLICQIGGMAAELASPLFIGLIIDTVIKKDNEDQIRKLVLYWMGITVTSSVVDGVRGFIMNTLTHKIGYKLRQDIFEDLMKKNIEFFDSHKTGKIMSAIQNDVQKLEAAMSTQIGLLLRCSLFVMTVMIILFFISWRMTLFMIAVMMPLFIYARMAGKWFRAAYKKISDAAGKVSEVSQECFGNIRTIKAFGTEDYQSRVQQDRLDDLYRVEKSASNLRAIHEFMMSGVIFCCMDAIIWMSSFLYFNYGFTIGQINSFNSYLFSILFNFAMLSTVATEVFAMYGTMANIAELMLYEPNIKIEGGDEVTTESISDGSLRLESIKFTYPTKEEITVINGATIEVPKDKTVALVGSSGCGKSTIIQLIERFYDPDGGCVKYGQQDLKNLNAASYKSNVAIVQQEPVLFSGSIRDNIVYGMKQVPNQQEIEFVCEQANVHQFVSDKALFPEGYHTLVGERGIKLSGGQKQRIAIARALVRKPKVLLLDEATSALDAESEHQVQQALDQILQNEKISQTVVVIAHRLSTIKDADAIIVLNKGQIAEYGTHSELIEKDGAYAKLVRRQLASMDN